jgi:hypothetical protein
MSTRGQSVEFENIAALATHIWLWNLVKFWVFFFQRVYLYVPNYSHNKHKLFLLTSLICWPLKWRSIELALMQELNFYTTQAIYKVVQIWPGQIVTCLHTNRPGHIWTTLYVQRNIEARSENYCCCRKAIIITCLCVCVRACSLACLACKSYAPCCDVICGPFGFIFSTLSHKRHDLRKKKYWT